MVRVVPTSSSLEYFKDLVERAVQRRKLHTSELSCFYVVQLLDSFVGADASDRATGLQSEQPLAQMICHALASDGQRRLKLLRLTGDSALFLSGFFSDRVHSRAVGLDYYVRMGGCAYAHAAASSSSETSALFQELANKFVHFVDVLNEVSEESSLTQSPSLLRLYEKWLETGSKRSEEMLKREGILLDDSSKTIH